MSQMGLSSLGPVLSPTGSLDLLDGDSVLFCEGRGPRPGQVFWNQLWPQPAAFSAWQGYSGWGHFSAMDTLGYTPNPSHHASLPHKRRPWDSSPGKAGQPSAQDLPRLVSPAGGTHTPCCPGGCLLSPRTRQDRGVGYQKLAALPSLPL